MLEHSLPDSGLSDSDNNADSDAPERGWDGILTVSVVTQNRLFDCVNRARGTRVGTGESLLDQALDQSPPSSSWRVQDETIDALDPLCHGWALGSGCSSGAGAVAGPDPFQRESGAGRRHVGSLQRPHLGFGSRSDRFPFLPLPERTLALFLGTAPG